MRISVVIPARNEAATIASAVDSAWAAGADQVIVVDGMSHDDTPERAAWASKVITTQPGRGHQQNVGARAADGDWLLFLHADSRLGGTAIEQLRETTSNSRIRHGAFRQRIEAAGILYRWLEWGNATRVRLLGLPYGDQGIYVERNFFDSQQGFPEIRLMEDYLLMRRLRRHSWPALLPGPVFVSARRWQNQGVVRQTIRNWTLLTAYHLGVSPERLARRYYGQEECNSGEDATRSKPSKKESLG